MPLTGRQRAGLARLLDANLNRAREGLRVVEDTARFVWDDQAFYIKVRGLRHALHRITAKFYKEFLTARESDVDAGRRVREKKRGAMADVVAANMRRAQEAVRVLEEYSKVFSPAAAPKFKQVRYALYQEEKKVLKRI